MLLPTIRVVLLALAVAPAAVMTASAAQQNPQEPADAAVDDVNVTTASRFLEKLINAPATMTVLTTEVIGRAPAQSVTDLLRLVPGLNTVQSSARDVNVSSRAATGTLADSMLVLLDGRSIYQDFFGFVAWDFLPIDVHEVKQIEVIRGPASAVWGANAMTGVINVISKTPREMEGTSVAIQLGQFDRSRPGGSFETGSLFSISARHAKATSDRFAYKISAGFLTQEPYLRPTGTVLGNTSTYPQFPNRGTTQPRLDARADYDLADGQRKIVMSAGIAGTEGIVHTGLGPLDVQRGSTFKYGRLTFTRSTDSNKLKLQFFVNALDGESPPMLQTGLDGQPLDFRFENQAYDVEISSRQLFSTRRVWHDVSYGGNYRHNNFDLSFARGSGNRDEGGAYVQDQIFLSERGHFRWVVGGRVDRFDVLKKAVFSPRTALLIKPSDSQTIRLSFNRAFRAPSFVNSLLHTTLLAHLDLAKVGSAGDFSFPTLAEGNVGLKEESLTAYELGYIGQFGGTTLGAAIYLNRTRNMIQFTEAPGREYYTSSHPPPGWPLQLAVLDQLAKAGHGLPWMSTYLNFDRISDHGIELSADTHLTRALSAFANYTWQADPTPSGFAAEELNLPPTHRLNAGATVNHNRYFGSLTGSVVDGAYWQDVLAPYRGVTASYTLIDASLGLHSTDGMMTFAVRGSNLLNKPVPQHVFGDIITRTITGEVRFGF